METSLDPKTPRTPPALLSDEGKSAWNVSNTCVRPEMERACQQGTAEAFRAALRTLHSRRSPRASEPFTAKSPLREDIFWKPGEKPIHLPAAGPQTAGLPGIGPQKIGRVTRTTESRKDRCIIHFHGGGFCASEPEHYDDLSAKLAEAGQATVLVPQIRQTPECSHAELLKDCIAVYRHVSRRFRPDRLLLSGDSSGGNLALAVLLHIASEKEELAKPAGAILMSPYGDLSEGADQLRDASHDEPWLVPDLLEIVRNNSTVESFDDPSISPLLDDEKKFAELPPLFIHTGSTDMLRSQSLRLAEKVDAPILLDQPGIWHAALINQLRFPEEREALKKIAEFCEGHFG
ncbi:alpha/beta hydrolase [bacterium]|nr:alpha/beta hydrolase [bacterium]